MADYFVLTQSFGINSEARQENHMPFEPPKHPGHVFLGYRGVSNAHFRIDENKQIRYIPPPADVAGDVQLGRGVYVTSDLRDASDYAKDSAWNLQKRQSKRFRQDDPYGMIYEPMRKEFEKHRWESLGRIHAVYMPEAKESKAPIADFSQIDLDRSPFHGNDMGQANMAHALKRDPVPHSGISTAHNSGAQTMIYAEHAHSLFVKDITREATDFIRREDQVFKEEMAVKQAEERRVAAFEKAYTDKK